MGLALVQREVRPEHLAQTSVESLLDGRIVEEEDCIFVGSVAKSGPLTQHPRGVGVLMQGTLFTFGEGFVAARYLTGVGALAEKAVGTDDGIG